MAQNDDGTTAEEPIHVDPRSATSADELRSRMRLRLATNSSRSSTQPVTGNTTATAQSAPTLPKRDRVKPADVSTMVWNSVLESTTKAFRNPAVTQTGPVSAAADLPAADLAATDLDHLSPRSQYWQQSAPGVDWSQLVAEAAAAARDGGQPPLSGLLDAAPSPAPDLAPAIPVAAPVATPVAAPIQASDPIPAPAPIPLADAARPALPDGMIVPSIPVRSQPSRAAAPLPSLTADQKDQHDQHDQHDHRPASVRNATRPKPKRKRHPFRAFFAFLVVAGLLGGAAYAGWYYFLRNQVTWATDVKPLAEFVQETLHRQFTESVDVVTLPVSEYEVKLGIVVVDQAYADPDGSLTALRAVGVAGPVASPSEVGHVVASVRTSFYAPADSTIYRLAGTTSLHELAMVRSLSSALVDQQIAWSKDFTALTDSQQVGLLAIVNSVADEVANAKAEGSAREAAGAELVNRLQAVGFDGDQIPQYVRMAMWPGLMGIPRHPAAPVDDPLDGLAVPLSDAVVFDLTREATAAALTVAPPPSTATATQTLGVQFWYAAMAPALGVSAARDAALLWAGDTSAITMVNNFPCINANIATANETDQAAMSAALMQWAQTRPASSAAVVATQPGNITSVSMCEPAEGGTDALGDPSVLEFVSRAGAEAEVAQALLQIGLPDTRAAWNCAVVVRRGGTLSDYKSGTVDPVVISLMNDVVRLCSG